MLGWVGMHRGRRELGLAVVGMMMLGIGLLPPELAGQRGDGAPNRGAADRGPADRGAAVLEDTLSTELTSPPAGEATAIMPISRLQGEITLDGIPDEVAWQAIEPLPVVQFWPEFGAEMTQRTEIRVAFDDEYFYAAGRFYDDPDGIRGNSLLRDQWNGDDAFDIIIDSFNDDATALKFTTTPLGILLDQEIRNDAQGGTGVPPINGDWNTFWDAETHQTDEGWFAEIRIPLSSLAFSVNDDQAIMGLIAARYIARKDEKHIFPAIEPNWDMADFKPSLARDVVLTDIQEQKPLWVTPYAVVGLAQTRNPDLQPVRAPGTEIPTEAGFDLKYGLSSNLTLDLTVNTDFAQAEADALQVNLDRFSLFVPEKRQFFQERSSTFEFNFGEEGRLFHSRRIGLTPDGQAQRIWGGARVAGRIGSWDVGGLAMQVAGIGSNPGTNDGVIRLSRSFQGGATVGGMLTSRIRTQGRAAFSVGVDGQVPLGRELITLQFGQTRNDGAGGFSALERSSARALVERRNLDGFGYTIDALYSGGGFNPELGFQRRRDFTRLNTRFSYGWRPEGSSRVARYRFYGVTRAFRRNQDGALETGLVRGQFVVNLRGGNYFNLTLNGSHEDVAEEFPLPGGTVPAGTYRGLDMFTAFGLSQARAVSGSVWVWAGQAFDGWRVSATVEPNWTVSRHLDLGLLAQVHRIWFPERDQEVVADQMSLRIRTALNAKLSAEAFVQYSRAGNAMATNVRVRYRFAEGRDLFIVLNEARDLDDRFGLDSAILGRSDQRLLIKYSHAFSP